MTVLVGVRCKDGVVIGSDSAQTSAAGDGKFTTSLPGRKIDIVAESLIVAHTGQMGMGQRFTDTLTKAWGDGAYKSKQPLDVVRHMATTGTKDFASTMARPSQYGALVAFPNSSSGAQLCEFAIQDFQPELKSDLFFCSMGSGQSVVDPYLALFKKAFWEGGPPSVEDGTFAVIWALQLAIELCPVGVGGPITVATLKKGKASFLDKDEIGEHIQSIESVVNHLGQYKQAFVKPGADTPTIPKP